MSFKDQSSKLESTEDGDSSDLPQPASFPSAFSPDRMTLHIHPSPIQDTSSSISHPSLSSPRDSTEGSVAVYRRHIVVHGLSCDSDMGCDIREGQGPVVTRRAMGIPRVHVVAASQVPIRYNLNALWTRPLSKGPLIGVGDQIWVDGLGEVELGESLVAGASPYWKFFRAFSSKSGTMEMATEWSYVRLTSEEYEHRAGSRYAGRGSGSASAQLNSFLEFGEDVGWLQSLISFWKGLHSRFMGVLLHRVVDSEV